MTQRTQPLPNVIDDAQRADTDSRMERRFSLIGLRLVGHLLGGNARECLGRNEASAGWLRGILRTGGIAFRVPLLRRIRNRIPLCIPFRHLFHPVLSIPASVSRNILWTFRSGP